MSAIVKLDELIRSTSPEIAEDDAIVTQHGGGIIFSYKLRSPIIDNKLLGLNDYLKYKIYPSMKGTGKISFEVVKVEIKDNLSVTVNYYYIPRSYLDILPKGVIMIIINKLNDVQNSYKAYGSDPPKPPAQICVAKYYPGKPAPTISGYKTILTHTRGDTWVVIFLPIFFETNVDV